MGDTFWKSTNEFIDQITELKCETWWHFDTYEKGLCFHYLDAVYSRFCRLIRLGGARPRGCRYSLLESLHEPAYYSAIDRETFYSCVREYLNKVLASLNERNTEYLMVDQLLPPSNLERYLNYFDDIRVIVTDRDPRDIFISANELWKEKVIPYTDVEEYCKWYEITRRHRKTEQYDPKRVFFLRFEDLIYRYEQTGAALARFVGLDQKSQDRRGMYLQPSVSIKNTNLKHRFPQYREAVAFIESHLQEYLYDFESAGSVDCGPGKGGLV